MYIQNHTPTRLQASSKGYKKLRVWQEAHRLVLAVYQLTDPFPKSEILSLTSQIRRAVISIVANIVEGQAKGSNKDFLRFLKISNGSLLEVEYYLELCLELNYISKKQYEEIESQRLIVGNLLNGLIKSLRLKITRP